MLIGASTGGPGHIQYILSRLPKQTNTSYVIAQHMGAEFIPSFIERMEEQCPLPTQMPRDNGPLLSGHVYICSGNTTLHSRTDGYYFHCRSLEHANGYNPNINALFHSAARLASDTELLGIILTGIGDDGVDGCREIVAAHGKCIAESAESAIVDGMPGRARERIPTITVSTLEEITRSVMEFSS